MNYTEIKDAAKAYADRNDIDVSNNMDTFILLAEARINRVLKTREQTHRISTPTFDGREFYALPPDYNGMRAIKFHDGPIGGEGTGIKTLSYMTPEQIAILQESEYDETKNYYTMVANQIQLHKTLPGGGFIELVFYRKVPSLNAVTISNWMSEDHPDIYISGIISEIESFVKNYDASKLWNSKMSAYISELQQSDTDERWAGSVMQIRTM